MNIWKFREGNYLRNGGAHSYELKLLTPVSQHRPHCLPEITERYSIAVADNPKVQPHNEMEQVKCQTDHIEIVVFVVHQRHVEDAHRRANVKPEEIAVNEQVNLPVEFRFETVPGWEIVDGIKQENASHLYLRRSFLGEQVCILKVCLHRLSEDLFFGVELSCLFDSLLEELSVMIEELRITMSLLQVRLLVLLLVDLKVRVAIAIAISGSSLKESIGL
tara:strand:+ start:254 stop:910 length:657 start_codon:yes stop_codon:yes gene_type:complete